jgi:hypothetical protein
MKTPPEALNLFEVQNLAADKKKMRARPVEAESMVEEITFPEVTRRCVRVVSEIAALFPQGDSVSDCV